MILNIKFLISWDVFLKELSYISWNIYISRKTWDTFYETIFFLISFMFITFSSASQFISDIKRFVLTLISITERISTIPISFRKLENVEQHLNGAPGLKWLFTDKALHTVFTPIFHHACHILKSKLKRWDILKYLFVSICYRNKLNRIVHYIFSGPW